MYACDMYIHCLIANKKQYARQVSICHTFVDYHVLLRQIRVCFNCPLNTTDTKY